MAYESVKEKDKDGNLVIKTFEGDIVNPETGELKKIDGEWKCRSKDFAKWMSANPKLREFYYGFICDRIIMNYKVNEDFGIEDIIIDEEFISEES